MNTPTSTLTFLGHVDELRRRFFLSVLSVLGGSIIGYFFNQQLLEFLIRPLHQSIYYTSPGGGLDLMIRSSILFGLLLSSPIIMYHIVKFIQPATSHVSEDLIGSVLFASWACMIAGVTIAYYFSLPAALHFLEGFSSDSIKSLISTDKYFSFISLYLMGFAIFFQLPVVMLIINRMHPLQPSKLLGYVKYIILGSFVLAAIITPTPDLINQAFMALPAIALYMLSIVVIVFVNLRRPQLSYVEQTQPLH